MGYDRHNWFRLHNKLCEYENKLNGFYDLTYIHIHVSNTLTYMLHMYTSDHNQSARYNCMSVCLVWGKESQDMDTGCVSQSYKKIKIDLACVPVMTESFIFQDINTNV